MTFWLDTQLLWATDFLEEIAPLCARRGHRLSISPVVHAERIAQIRRRNQPTGSYLARLEQFDIHVGSEERGHAEAAAEVLYSVYPDRDAWRRAALDMYARRLRVEPILLGKNDTCTGAADPFIAAFAVGRRDRFVSEDFKEERLPHDLVISKVEALALAAVA